MVFGFNHNFRYKGGVYHVQTEDGGEKNPQVVTLLYHGGTILSSQKTSYAELVHTDNLEKQVEELMKNQHRDMLRRLKEGEFDAQIEPPGAESPPEAAPPPSVAAPAPAPAPVGVAVSGAARAAAAVRAPVPPRAAVPSAVPAAVDPAPAKPAPPAAPAKPATEPSLDDIILSYLMGEDR